MMRDPTHDGCRCIVHHSILDVGVLLTKDEHDPAQTEKPFPDKAYLQVMLECLLLTRGFVSQGYAGRGAACLVWELGRIRFRERSDTQMQYHVFEEEIEDKVTHAWDCLKMQLHKFRPEAPKTVLRPVAWVPAHSYSVGGAR